MFLDASVLVAIFNYEEGAGELERRVLGAAAPIYVSPMVKFEASVAMARANWARTGATGQDRAVMILEARNVLEKYLTEIDARELPITAEVGDESIRAAATFGKVVGHKAGLNMGDCFSYACAKSLNVPLLYKGNDFAQTDLA